jgi:hypothetical protein
MLLCMSDCITQCIDILIIIDGRVGTYLNGFHHYSLDENNYVVHNRTGRPLSK